MLSKLLFDDETSSKFDNIFVGDTLLLSCSILLDLLAGRLHVSTSGLRGQVIGAQRFEHLNIRNSFLSPRTHFCQPVLISQ